MFRLALPLTNAPKLFGRPASTRFVLQLDQLDSDEVVQLLRQNSRIIMHEIVPAGATVLELKKKATECEEQAKHAAEPEAMKLREEALLYRQWIAVLRSGKWHS